MLVFFNSQDLNLKNNNSSDVGLIIQEDCNNNVLSSSKSLVYKFVYFIQLKIGVVGSQVMFMYDYKKKIIFFVKIMLFSGSQGYV